MLSDTVGFVADLPTTLVAAFRATLEEVTEADVILHVRDAANPDSAAQAQDVLKVLGELGVSGDKTPIIEVWNKIDLLEVGRDTLRTMTPAGSVAATVPVSAQTGEGIPALLDAIEATLAARSKVFRVRIPHASGADVGWLYGHAEIIAKGEPDEEGQTYEVRVDPRHKASFIQRFAGRIEAG
jgi:GTP-binding protein HflX